MSAPRFISSDEFKVRTMISKENTGYVVYLTKISVGSSRTEKVDFRNDAGSNNSLKEENQPTHLPSNCVQNSKYRETIPTNN